MEIPALESIVVAAALISNEPVVVISISLALPVILMPPAPSNVRAPAAVVKLEAVAESIEIPAFESIVIFFEAAVFFISISPEVSLICNLLPWCSIVPVYELPNLIALLEGILIWSLTVVTPVTFNSSPIKTSLVTDKPPSVCIEPFVALVAFVVSSTIILLSVVNWPVEVIVTPELPAPPAISKSPLSSTRNTSVPSYCLKTKSSLSTFNCIITSPTVPSISSANWFTPPSWKLISPVVELKSKEPVESTDIGVAAIVKPVVPSWVNVASLSAPKLNTALSDNNLTSLPITAFLVTDKPPLVCKEPSPKCVASVVLRTFIIPVGWIISRVEEPIWVVPPSYANAVAP